MSDGRAQHRRIPTLGDARGLRIHRATHIDDQMTIEIGLGVVLLDIEPVVASEKLPVQVSQVVAGQVFPMRGEFDREPDVGAAVQPVQKALDDRRAISSRSSRLARSKVSIYSCSRLAADAGFSLPAPPFLKPTNRATRSPGAKPERSRGARLMVLPFLVAFRSPGYFAGTISINLRIRPSASMPSDRAWKFKTRRWRSTGNATDRTSAKST